MALAIPPPASPDGTAATTPDPQLGPGPGPGPGPRPGAELGRASFLALGATGAALIAVTYGLARFSLGLFVPELQASFGLSATGIGVVLGGSFAGYLAALVAAGGLVARLGPRLAVLLSGGLATAGMLGVALAPTGGVLGVAAVVGGSSAGIASPALATAVHRGLAASRRASAQTVVNAGTSLGLLVAAGAAMSVTAGWRAVWVVFAGLGLLAALAAGRAVPAGGAQRDERVAAGQGATPGADPGGTGPARSSRRWLRPGWRLAAVAVLLGGSSAAFWGFGRELVDHSLGLAPAASQLVWAAAGLGGLLGAAAGSLADRVGLRRTLAATWGLSVTAHLVLARTPHAGDEVATSAEVVTVAVAVAAVGATYMALTGLLIVWSVHRWPDEPAAAVASAFALLAVGQVVGSPLLGMVVDRAGVTASFLVAAAVAAAGSLVRP